jgi:hypothetical protein
MRRLFFFAFPDCGDDGWNGRIGSCSALETPTPAYLSMSTKKLRTLIQSGELMVIKTGDNTCPWLIDIVEINRWIDRAQVRL